MDKGLRAGEQWKTKGKNSLSVVELRVFETTSMNTALQYLLRFTL